MLSRHESSGLGPMWTIAGGRGATPSALLWSPAVSARSQDVEGLTSGLLREIQTGFIHPPGEDPEYYATQRVFVVRVCDLSG